MKGLKIEKIVEVDEKLRKFMTMILEISMEECFTTRIGNKERKMGIGWWAY